MIHCRPFFASLLLLAPLVACSSTPGPSDAPDAGYDPDAVAPVALADSGSDTAAPDAAAPCPVDLSADPHNCGACGHDCLGATCAGSVCAATTLSSGQVAAVAVDDAGVYWADREDESISALPNGASAPAVVASFGTSPVQQLSAIGGTLYWGTTTTQNAQGLAIYGAPTSGRNATPSVVMSDPSLCDVDFGAELAYAPGSLFAACGGSLWSVPLPSGQPTASLQLPAAAGPSLVADPSGTWMFMASPPAGGNDAGVLLGATIARVTLAPAGAAGGPTLDYPVEATNMSGLSGNIAADTHTLYWLEGPCATCSPAASIKTWPLAGGATTTLATTLPGVSGYPSFWVLAVNGTSLFVAGATPDALANAGAQTQSTGALYEIPLDGRPPFLLAVATQIVWAVAADATYAYFIDGAETGGNSAAVAYLRRVPR